MNSVCIYGGYVAEALRGADLKGGAELQMALLAKTLALNGVNVTVIDPTVNEDSHPFEHLTVRHIPHWDDGPRGIRFFTNRLPNFIRTLKASKADLFYARGFSYHYLIPMLVAKQSNARFILAIASDFDLLKFRERYALLYKRRSSAWTWISKIIPSEIGHLILLSSADVVLVQHERQAEVAKTRAKCVVRLNNLIDMETFQVHADEPRRNILVVGTFSAYKGLGVLLPIVRSLPNLTFEFVGEIRDIEGEGIYAELERCPNVILRGALDRKSTLQRIAASKALVNTSLHEGFPNTFLEAWAVGTPVISLYVDPGDVIRTHHLGYVCDGDLEMFKNLLQQESYDVDASLIKKYILQHHSLDYAVRVFRKLLGQEGD